jgi:cyclic pyranopterin monophosphate synthase
MLPFTARIERPQFHRGGSASKKGTWPLPAPPLTALSTGSYNHLKFFLQRADSASKMAEFTHFNESGRARMVDVSAKNSTERAATAQARVFLQPETLEKIQRGKIAKGDVLSVAQVAGVMGAKKTPDLIPMCHPILLTSVDISFKEESQPDREGRCSITILATAKTTGPTGVEMEAITAASVAALTIYDMCKAIDREMSFSEVCLLSKSGGKSGTFTRR